VVVPRRLCLCVFSYFYEGVCVGIMTSSAAAAAVIPTVHVACTHLTVPVRLSRDPERIGIKF
jgi:hypothetical protein